MSSIFMDTNSTVKSFPGLLAFLFNKNALSSLDPLSSTAMATNRQSILFEAVNYFGVTPKIQSSIASGGPTVSANFRRQSGRSTGRIVIHFQGKIVSGRSTKLVNVLKVDVLSSIRVDFVELLIIPQKLVVVLERKNGEKETNQTCCCVLKLSLCSRSDIQKAWLHWYNGLADFPDKYVK